MSKTSTETRLLERARELFNERGLDVVGVRELARDLGLSPGNVSYYFPKKEDLVAALMAELREHNTTAAAKYDASPTLAAFMDRIRGALHCQHEYRCIARAITHIVGTWPRLGDAYRAVELQRRRSLVAALETARRSGDLAASMDEQALARIVATSALVARFWISESELSLRGVESPAAIDHYVSLIAHALLPYTTKRGATALAPHLDGVLTARSLGLEAARRSSARDR